MTERQDRMILMEVANGEMVGEYHCRKCGLTLHWAPSPVETAVRAVLTGILLHHHQVHGVELPPTFEEI